MSEMENVTAAPEAPQAKINAFDLSLDEWRAFVQEKLDLPRYTADQICQWIYQKKVFDFAAMTNLSKAARAALPELVEFHPICQRPRAPRCPSL